MPAAEVCDGGDNVCNCAVDEGNRLQCGVVCCAIECFCVPGSLACVSGALDCVGDVGPQPEQCNNLDDDCNGVIDDGIPAMGPCTMPYDAVQFPGDRSFAPCQPGQLECDGQGNLVCVGGVGPQPELCDGINNDCDGMNGQPLIDENGAAPDGIDGSPNPFPPPAASIGDACGVTTGACEPGSYACLNGLFACLGGEGPLVETCDCADNDCDGLE